MPYHILSEEDIFVTITNSSFSLVDVMYINCPVDEAVMTFWILVLCSKCPHS